MNILKSNEELTQFQSASPKIVMNYKKKQNNFIVGESFQVI
jgi:hypothetical protein